MDKTQFITDFKNGDEVNAVFLIAAAQQGQARNGPFWRLELRDASGSLEAKIWSPQSQAYPQLTAGDLAVVAGRITMFRDKLEVAVDRLRILDADEKDSLDLSLFIPASERSAEEMLGELQALARRVLAHPPWRKLVLGLLGDKDIVERLLVAPAAKNIHHAYAGGLLEHTLSVAQLCLLLADKYQELDRQALFAGAVCHDMGKLWEMTSGLHVDYTSEGRLLGHMQLALDFLEEPIRASCLEEPLALHLRHLILSHHGLLEFGSPRLPATAEALALHYADNIDAKLNMVQGALASLPAGESGWSAYVQPLERHLFQSPKTPGREGKERGRPANARNTVQGNADGQLSLLPG